MAERKFDDFDNYAKDYRSIHTRNLALSGADSLYFAKFKIHQIKKYESQHPLKFLDVGCGDGATELFVEEIFPAWRIDAIDVSEKTIDHARQRLLKNSDFNLYDGETVPFNSESFDIVFIAAVLHHVDFALHQKIILEVYRVLKPGGRIYIFEHNPLNPLTKYLVRTCEFDKDARLLGYRYTKKLLKQTGLKNILVRFIIFFPRKGIFSKLIFLERLLAWLPLGGQYFYRAIK